MERTEVNTSNSQRCIIKIHAKRRLTLCDGFYFFRQRLHIFGARFVKPHQISIILINVTWRGVHTLIHDNVDSHCVISPMFQYFHFEWNLLEGFIISCRFIPQKHNEVVSSVQYIQFMEILTFLTCNMIFPQFAHKVQSCTPINLYFLKA